jgi:serine phosphatase RsbU (regulator of sigma subunit)
MGQERHADHIFTTLASLSVDLTDGTASVGLAGHPPPILSVGGRLRLLTEEVGGPPLGLAEPPEWRLTEVDLGEDWSLLLYSDGIYEGRLGDRPERLGIEGLLGVLADAPGGSREYGEHPERLIDRVEEINQGPLVDDVALLSVTCRAGAG